MPDNRDKIKQLAQNVRNNPSDSFSKFALALELLKNNQPHKALALFESIYTLDPEYLGVYYHLGKLYQLMNRFQDAKTCFKEGIVVAEHRNEERTLSELKEALTLLEEEKNYED
jgi:tetratricopeptide (TPR) repeat protein